VFCGIYYNISTSIPGLLSSLPYDPFVKEYTLGREWQHMTNKLYKLVSWCYKLETIKYKLQIQNKLIKINNDVQGQ